MPTKLSTDEKPPPMEKMPVGRSVTSTLTMIFVLSEPGCGAHVDLLEVAQVDQALAGPLQLLQREEVPLGHGDLAPQDLVLAARVPGDVDALDVDLGPFVDLEESGPGGGRRAARCVG